MLVGFQALPRTHFAFLISMVRETSLLDVGPLPSRVAKSRNHCIGLTHYLKVV